IGSVGGEGASGGASDTVTVINQAGGSIGTGSTDSPGVLAQSIGGGGGNGGDSKGWMSIGGSGAVGADGAQVVMTNQGSITTSGSASAGLMGQSIGGGGGNGGNAKSSGLGINLTIGGSGAGGGNGSTVTAFNGGAITTTGQHSSGMELQSIGGGGGKGGAAFGDDISGVFGAQEAVGGSGGGGGTSQAVGNNADQGSTNAGTIRTGGSDSFGIVAQSIGGGGGIGAASTAEAKTYAPDNLPSLSMSVAIGGTGGAGGAGNTVVIDNAGFIGTTGTGSIGMVAQSIGGGGGTGGDAKATSTANGGNFNASVSTAIGGNGGGAGDGNYASADNGGLIVTTGESADGMLVQSIGGGGGSGGGGDAKSNSTGGGTGIGASITIGGKSGGGGNALLGVESTNGGAILTLGDGASGIVAQAIGGGGGRAGGAAGTAKANGDNGDFAATLSIGGKGGNGGSTFSTTTQVSVTNSATASIVTFGADAPAIVAQSIGGGGGLGGKSATTLSSKKSTGDGGNGVASTDTTLDNIGQAFKAGGIGQFTSTQALVDQANALLTDTSTNTNGSGTNVRLSKLGDPESDAGALNDLGASQDDQDDDGGTESKSITAKIGIGGQAGGGGAGGTVTVSNAGSIGTVGALSDGILAQSIGGGGGKGGAATAAGTKGDANASVGVGGTGGSGGSAGDVKVTNAAGGSIVTTGALANGIVAQSISGGGGMGGVGGSRNGALSDTNLTLGADGGRTGLADGAVSSGLVTVTNEAGASIITQSHNASAIIAQSIGGGGGIAKSFSTDAQDNNGGAAVKDPVGADDKNPAHGIHLTFGGSANKLASDGWAGDVVVNQNGSVTTSGRNAYGVLAQSIGGGGGAALGGSIANGGNFFGTGEMRGDGGSTTVNAGGNITTSGQGAIAILAQSIGGGGGLAGDTGWTAQQLGFDASWNHPGNGNGGAVNVSTNTGTTLTTTAASNTPVIWAQSIGGGGGRITTQQGAYTGSAGGTGNGGPVNIVVGGTVSALGQASPGIYAESSGKGGAGTPGSIVDVTVEPGGKVSGGTDFSAGDGSGAAVQVMNGSTSSDTASMNAVINLGTLTSVDGVAGTAVIGTNGNTYVHNLFGALMDGSVDVTAGTGKGYVLNNGTWNTGSTVAAVSTRNDGVLDIGGKGATGAATVVHGDLVQGDGGRIVFDSDHVAGASDRLTVEGNAMLAGAVQMRPARLSPNTVQVMDVKGGTLDDAQLRSADPMLVHYQLATAGTTAADGTAEQSVFVTPQANFDSAATGLGKNAQSVAGHLQANFDAGAGGLGVPLALLANGVNDPATYKAALASMSNEAQQTVGTTRLAASHAFVDRMNSCPTFDQAQGTDMKERECGWARVIDNRTTDGASSRANYSAGTHTVQVGGQKQIADGWFLGASAAYDTESANSATGAGSVSGTGGSVGVVLKREIGHWTFSGSADLGYGSYDSTRNIAFPGFAAQATGSFNLTQAGLHSRIAYLMPQDNWYLKPYLDLHAVHMHSSGYGEQGAGPLGLNVDGNSDTMYSASPMLEVGGRMELGNGMTVRPYATVGATVHDKNQWGATARFQGAAPGVATFDTAASAPTNLGNVRLGVSVTVKKNLELKAEYGAQFGSGYRSNEGILRVNYLF
uniref:autotransporter outer membrane beta-barrel domain-containing protein n=2 Tax=Variovorax sp. KK3 TaxID=1855728 RepID=UPI00097BDCCA